MSRYTLTRDIPIEDECDVLVAGGGPAGVAAAVCAAGLGARVVLAEATGCLGGMGTSGLVNAFDPMADGERMLVGGFMREVVETMYARGFLAPHVTPDFWLKQYHRWTPFRCEGLKLVLDEFATDAGVEVRFFTRLIDVDVDDQARTVRGAVLHNVEGYCYVPAKAFIDATGDAVLASLCGAECREAGRDTERIMPATLASLHAGVDWGRVGDQHKSVNQHEALERAIDDGHFTQPDRHLPGMSQVGDKIGYLNGGHVFNLDALRCRSLSDGMMLGRRLVREYVDFYRKYVAGCENMELVTTASLMGVRESRRIVGEYELTIDDYMARRQFPDQIGLFNKFVDVHVYDTSAAEWERFQREHNEMRLGEGECFGIPYRILVPRGWQNLWVAGRCNSSDVLVHGSIRVMPAAAMMGQAAGTAAVQAIKTGQSAVAIDAERLLTTLREQGAYLPE
jgi:FAD-dependent oxidoreductase family protein